MVKMKILVCLSFALWCLGLLDHDASGADTDEVSVMEGDSVTLNTGVQTNQQDRIIWYYNAIRIAQINRDLSKICTDVQCNEGTERFRDRLKLDPQTGSLTIINITNTHSGEYTLKIISGRIESDEILSVSVLGVSAAERDQMKIKTVKEGESVTLYTGVGRKPNGLMQLYFNDILITEITGDQSKICTDVQCEERFRDRLKLDHQTGSLNITHTRNTDSGEYTLQISNSRFSIMKSFSVSITAVPDSGLSSAAVGGICAAVVLLAAAAAAAVICYLYRSKQTGDRTPRDDPPQEYGLIFLLDQQGTETAQVDGYNETSNNETETPQVDDDNETSNNETDTAQADDDNGTSHNETETAKGDDDNGMLSTLN